MWDSIHSTQVEDLRNARLEAHWASQTLIAVTDVVLDRMGDDSQSNLGWNATSQALETHTLPGGEVLAFHPARMELHFTNSGATFSLHGKTIDDVLAWVQGASAIDFTSVPTLRDYDMPGHPVQEEKPFSAPGAVHAELARWFHHANELFLPIQKEHPDASPVRCWPHHFDLATLLSFDPEKDPHEARSIGVGFSPGDSGYEEPYFYVNPWPRDDFSPLPDLPIGAHWHTDGWFGAVLPASTLIQQNASHADVDAFLHAAMAQEKTWLSIGNDNQD